MKPGAFSIVRAWRTCIPANLMAVAWLAVAGPAFADPGGLVIRITDVRSDQGIVRVALHDGPRAFPRGQPLASTRVPAETGTVVARFPEVESGRYAVSFYHDEDADNEFDQIGFGMPLEGYGFSNDAPTLMGPPLFDTAAIDYDGGGLEIEARMRYQAQEPDY